MPSKAYFIGGPDDLSARVLPENDPPREYKVPVLIRGTKYTAYAERDPRDDAMAEVQFMKMGTYRLVMRLPHLRDSYIYEYMGEDG